MHLRGKAFAIRLTRLDGSKQVLLTVPHYDFNSQLNCELARPLKLATRVKLETTGWYDNFPEQPGESRSQLDQAMG
jgi:hypothetical protein